MSEHFSEKLVERLENTPHVEKFRDGPGRRRYRYYSHGLFDYDKAKSWWKSKVGQHFDKVFSEWCDAEWVPPEYRNMEGAEGGFTRTIMLDGILCAVYRWTVTANWHGVYVHPKTKIISYKNRKRGIGYIQKQAKERAKVFRIIGDYEQLSKVNGIWYKVTIAPTYEKSQYKYVDGKYVTMPSITMQTRKRIPYDTFGYKEHGKVTRKQLSKDELKQYGVTNDPVQYRGEPI